MIDLLSLHYSKFREDYLMEEDEVTVGKSDSCTLQLFEADFGYPINTISRCHFKISKAKDGFMLTDLLSRNGTKINDVKLIPNSAYYLRHGDIITLAKSDKFQLQVAIHRSDNQMTTLPDEPTLWHETKMIDSEIIEEPEPPEPDPIQFGFYFDQETERFVVDGHPIAITHFTELEHDFLRYLYQNANRLCSYSEITQDVWEGWVSSNNIISSAVARIRRKLNEISDGAGRRYIKTKKSFGYILTLNNES